MRYKSDNKFAVSLKGNHIKNWSISLLFKHLKKIKRGETHSIMCVKK